MSGTQRPLSVTIIGIVYILAGAMGLVYHATEFRTHPFPWGLLGIELVRVLAIVAGAYMLRGQNWARWLALLWMAFHVAISFLNGWVPVVMHTTIFVLIAFFLLRRTANEYFVSAKPA